MGIALSVLRCCLCLDDDDDRLQGRADPRVLSPYARIAEPPSAAWTRLSTPPRYDPTTSRSAATEHLLSTRQLAVATSVGSLPPIAASGYTTRARDSTCRPVGSASSTTLPTPVLCQLLNSSSQRSAQVRSSSHGQNPAPPPAVPSNQLPRASDAGQRSAQVQSSSRGQNPAPPPVVLSNQLPWASETIQRSAQVQVQSSTRGQNLLPPPAVPPNTADPTPRPVGSASSTTLPTPALSTPRLQRQHVESRGPSSSAVTGPAVGREASADSYGLSYEARRTAGSVKREVSGPLPDVARRFVSSTPSCAPSPPPAVPPNQLPRASEASQRSAQVQSSSRGQNPAPPPAVPSNQLPRASVASQRSAQVQSSSRGQNPAPSPAVPSNQLPRASVASQRSAQVQSSSRGQNPEPPVTSTPRRSQAPVAGGSASDAVGTRPVKREITSDVSRAARTHNLNGLSEKATQQAVSAAGAETPETQALNYKPPSQRNQVWAEKVTLVEESRNGSPQTPIPVYEIPPQLKEMIKLDKVPCVLKEELSASNYSEYFACLLYAEDFYLEKWSEFLLTGVTLEFHKRLSNETRLKDGTRYHKRLKDYVAFEIESVPAKRPYILSRDFVFLQPLETNCERIQGRVVRVQKGTKLLAEFEEDFWLQHSPEKRYNISFSFNRVCLKRAHYAVANALGPLLFSFLFPEKVHRAIETARQRFIYSRKLTTEQMCAVNQITNLKGYPPYLIAGPPCMTVNDERCSLSLTKTGLTIREAIIQIYRAHTNCRILICAPKNVTCDTLMIELSKEISESQQFRANAAFRDYEDVADEILPSCQFNHDDQRFTCPPLHELQAFKAVTSTYMSSFRLRRAGIKHGHFTHIFLVDASAVAEPEAVVPLANLASEDTAVVISGSVLGFPWYVRSHMARARGLKTSYFNRLLQRELYKNDSSFICRLSEDSSRVRDPRSY